MKKRYSEEQIIGFLKEAESDVATKELCRHHGFSDASFYAWRSRYGGMDVSEAKRLEALEAENTRLKKLLAEQKLQSFQCRYVESGGAKVGHGSGGIVRPRAE